MNHKSIKPIDIWIPSEVLCGPVKGMEKRVLAFIENHRNFSLDINNVKIKLYVSCPYEGMITARIT